MSKLHNATAAVVAAVTLSGAEQGAAQSRPKEWHSALAVPGVAGAASHGALEVQTLTAMRILNQVRLGETNITQGANGEHVALIQRALLKWAAEKQVELPKGFKADGDYRGKTEAALKTFQLKQGGGYSERSIEFGPRTLAVLEPWAKGERAIDELPLKAEADALRAIRSGDPKAQLYSGSKGDAAKAINSLLHIIDPKYPAGKPVIDGGTVAAILETLGKKPTENGYNPALVIGHRTAEQLLAKAYEAMLTESPGKKH